MRLNRTQDGNTHGFHFVYTFKQFNVFYLLCQKARQFLKKLCNPFKVLYLQYIVLSDFKVFLKRN